MDENIEVSMVSSLSGSESSSSDSDDDLLLLMLLDDDDAVRSTPLLRRRWDLNYLVPLAIQENSFVSEYRMDPPSFGLLVSMLKEGNLLPSNEVMGDRSSTSGHISVESKVGAALIMLAGGRYVEAMRTHGIAKATAFKNLKDVVKAINAHPGLEVKCDNSPEGLAERAAGFASRSSKGLFKYATGAMDGLTVAVSPRKVQNQLMYFSGGKKKFCVNMQAVCDANCIFIAFTCMHVGSTNDCTAFATSSLKDLCESQPSPYHWMADAAYPLLRTLIVPFPGAALRDHEDAFNFYLSQLRITIERAFGMLVQRWGIFWKKLKFDIPFCCEIIHACVRLHNFCIRRGMPIINQQHIPARAAVDANGALTHEDWRTVDPEGRVPAENVNYLRQHIVEEIIGRSLSRENRIQR